MNKPQSQSREAKAAQKRKERAKMKDQGLVRMDVWVYPHHKGNVRWLEGALRKIG